jgi:hypothetical protein
MKSMYSMVGLAILTAAIPAIASARGGDVSGGGSTVRGIVYENFLRGSTFDPRANGLSGERELELIRSKLPGLADRMAKIYDKRWFLVEPGDIQGLSREETGIPLYTEEVIYQNQRFVFVDKSWLAEANAKERSAMILHELWQSIRVDNNFRSKPDTRFIGNFGGYVKPEAVPEINLLLLDNPDMPPGELQKLARQMGFGSYATRAERERLMPVMEQLRKDISAACRLPKQTAIREALLAADKRAYDAVGPILRGTGLAAEFQQMYYEIVPMFGDSLGFLLLSVDNSAIACEQAGFPRAAADAEVRNAAVQTVRNGPPKRMTASSRAEGFASASSRSAQ